MTGRWRDPTAFRADPASARAPRPSRRQSVALAATLIIVAGAVAAASFLISPDRARTFDLFHGSLFLADTTAPVALDLASGRPTVRLADANTQVGAKTAADIDVVPLTEGTMLLNRATGEFNLVDSTGFVVKASGGVQLPQRDGESATIGLASRDYAYIVRTGSSGTSAYLVGQTTVQSASSPGARIKPRASRSMTAQVSTRYATASADNDLWLLAGSPTGRRTVVHLGLPKDSSPGAQLSSQGMGSVDGPAAIGAAGGALNAGQTIGVASADRLRIFRAGAAVATVRWKAPAGVDEVVPTSNGSTRLSFLLHGSGGWSVVSTDLDGGRVRGPTLLQGLAAGTRLVEPAVSSGSLYTMDTISSQLIRIGDDGTATALTGRPTYPQLEQNGVSIESSTFDDAYVLARGARVVYNSPNHQKALVVFTDRDSTQLSIDKNSAVVVNTAGGAAALTRSRQDPASTTKPDPSKGGTTPKPVDPVNNKIDCKATAQKPHIPQLGQPITGSRSVQLAWTYPITNQQDCYPSTYAVSVSTLSAGSPSAPATVPVQGQTSVNLTGLSPSTQYRITVTAYINGSGTPSPPIEIRTGPEGPAAPRNVAVTAGGDGSWAVTWASCGGVAAGCVPSASWRVIPQFCDGRGLSGAPGPIDVAADPTSVQQPGATLAGGDALLGRGVRFTVEGIGSDGAIGRPSDPSACVTSWSPSDASAMTLSATAPNTSGGGTSTATLSLNLGPNPVHAVGGVGGQILLRLTGPNGTVTVAKTFTGTGDPVTATFDGVQPGASYTATAAVSPPGHPDRGAGVSRAGALTTSTGWPTIGITKATCAPSGTFTCDLSFVVTGVSSSQANGERFDLSSDSTLTCAGGVGQRISMMNFDPGTQNVTVGGVSQLSGLFGSNCTIDIHLVESQGPTALYFGGQKSGGATSSVDLGSPKRSGAGSGDFSAAWTTVDGSSAVQITYTGSNPVLGALTQNWSETVWDPAKNACGVGTNAPTPTATVTASGACVSRYGQSAGWSVVVHYEDRVGGGSHDTTVVVSGKPPTYQPCAPGTFSATWGATRANGVTVTLAGGSVAGCSGWTYELDNSSGVCTASTSAPTTAPTVTVPLNCGTPATQGTWAMKVQWVQPDGASAGTAVSVTGSPPSG